MTEEATEPARAVAIARLAIGLAQGLALYLLYRAYDALSWPANAPLLFAPLLLIALFVPLLAIHGLGNLRRRTFAWWMVAAVIIIAALAAYDRWHAWPLTPDELAIKSSVQAHSLPTFALVFFSVVGFFIAHSLVTGGDIDRRFMARYPTHFDVAWKLGVQLVLSGAFVGTFWLLLWLGAELFDLIGLTFFTRLIEHDWFAIPVTTLGTAAALHVTDVRAGLVRGTRTLGLVLLSWLLPLMTLIGLGFLFALLFTGLQPLWNTRYAAGYLLLAAGALVILINATYQDGQPEHRQPAPLRYAARLAALLLLPLAALAAYAIALRVGQHGWTDERIGGAACTAVALCYAVGYAFAALQPSLDRIPRWNFYTALFVLAVLLALFSPLADPQRLSVASQIAQLTRGAVPPAQFDFQYLRASGGRYGHDALVELQAHASGPNAAVIRTYAAAALKNETISPAPPAPAEIAKNLTVYPRGAKLPESLLRQHWSDTQADGSSVPPCLTGGAACDVYLMDLDGDGRTDALFTSGGNIDWTGWVLTTDTAGRWSVAGMLTGSRCPAMLAALRKGQFRLAAPPPPRWRDIARGGHTLRVEPPETSPLSCKG